MLGNFSVGTGALILAGLLPLVASDLSISLSTAGQLMSVYALFYAIGAPVLSAATSSLPRKQVLIIALVLLAIANALGAFATGYAMMFMARAIGGLGGSMYTPSASAMAAGMSEPAYRTRAIGFVFSGISVATVLGVPLGTLIGNEFGWRVSLAAISVFAACVALSLTFVLPSGAQGMKFDFSLWKNLLKQSPVTLSVLTSFFQMAATFTIFTYIAPFLLQHAHVEKAQLTLYLTVFGVASMIGTFYGASIADKFGIVPTIIASLIGHAIAEFITPLVSVSVPVMVMCLAFWGVTCFAFFPAIQARLVGLVQTTQNIALSLNASALYGGQALGSYVGGVFLKTSGVEFLNWMGGSFAVVALGIFLLSLYAHRSAERPAQAV